MFMTRTREPAAARREARERPLRAAGLAALCSGVLLGACTLPGTAPDAEQTEVAVARAESEVKLALIESEDVDAAAVSVVATEDTVTLGGFVASEAEREAVLRVAREKAGGLEVVDDIEVRR